MKNILNFLTVFFVLAACFDEQSASTLTLVPMATSGALVVQEYYNRGLWEQCIVNQISKLNANPSTLDEAKLYCEGRLNQAFNENWKDIKANEENFETYVVYPFDSIEERSYYRGAFDQTFADILTYSGIQDPNVVLEITLEVIFDSVTKDQFNDNSFPDVLSNNESVFSSSRRPLVRSSTNFAFVLAGQSNMTRNRKALEKRLKQEYGPNTLSIKCAVGGSSIAQWQMGQKHFENCLTQPLDAIESGYKVRAILWFQGERDAEDGMLTSVYKDKFAHFVRDFRIRSGNTNLPIAYAQLGPVPEGWNAVTWNGIRSAQKTMDSRPGFFMFTTMDIARPFGDPHYTAAGYVIVTDRFIQTLRGIFQ